MRKILNNKWVIGIGTAVIAGVILYILFGQQSLTQFHYGTGDNVGRDKITNVSVTSLPERELNEESKKCILAQISKLGGTEIDFQLFGSWKTVANQTGGGMFGTPPDNETVGYAKEIANFLIGKGYKVSDAYTAISSFDANEPAFEGLLIKKEIGDQKISILVGPNNGAPISCN